MVTYRGDDGSCLGSICDGELQEACWQGGLEDGEDGGSEAGLSVVKRRWTANVGILVNTAGLSSESVLGHSRGESSEAGSDGEELHCAEKGVYLAVTRGCFSVYVTGVCFVHNV